LQFPAAQFVADLKRGLPLNRNIVHSTTSSLRVSAIRKVGQTVLCDTRVFDSVRQKQAQRRSGVKAIKRRIRMRIRIKIRIRRSRWRNPQPRNGKK
jgi:hypothetical protein